MTYIHRMSIFYTLKSYLILPSKTIISIGTYIMRFLNFVPSQYTLPVSVNKKVRKKAVLFVITEEVPEKVLVFPLDMGGLLILYLYCIVF